MPAAEVNDDLVVESRPAVGRVAGLPAPWTNTAQRLVLLALACDSYEGDVSRPGVENLARWCGLSPRATYDALRELSRPVAGVRPALVQRVDRYGRPISEGAKRGRERTGYRLFPDPSTVREPAGLEHPSTMREPAGLGPVVCGQPSPNPRPTVRPTAPSLPCPSPSTQACIEPTDRVRESDAHAEQDDESKPDWDAYRRHCVDVGARPNMPGFQAWQRNHTPNGDAA